MKKYNDTYVSTHVKVLHVYFRVICKKQKSYKYIFFILKIKYVMSTSDIIITYFQNKYFNKGQP